MCDDEPMPPWACFKVALPDFSNATNSFRSFAGKSFRATMTAGECAVGPIGMKSRAESYLMFGVSTGAATCDPMLPASSV